MGRDSDWTSKYLGSDHHTDRYVATVVRYEDKTGLSHQEPPYRVVADWMKNRGTMMAYNSVDYDSMAPVRHRRAVSMAYGDLDDVDDTYITPGFFPASRKALNISNKAMDDGDMRSSISSRKDQQLLSDITAKLHNIEMDEVRPSYDVALRTGGYRRTKRRQKRAPAGQLPGRSEERKDELRYPKNYAAVLACNNEDSADFNPRRWQVPERCTKVYQPRPSDDDFFTTAVTRKQRVPSQSDEAKIELMELLAKSRNVFAPLHEDQDDFVPQLAPLPTGDYRPYVSRYEPLTAEYEYDRPEHSSNPRIAQKIAESSRDIAEFDAMLDERFRKTSAPSRSRYSDFRSTVTSSPAEFPPVELPSAVEVEQAQADIAHPVTVKMHARKRQVAPRAFAGRGANIYTYVGLPDDVAYSRRMTRASSVPPRPILSAADYDYVPRPARRLEQKMYSRAASEPPEPITPVGYYSGRRAVRYEYPMEDVAVPPYAPTYYSARRSMYPPPASTVSRRVRYAYRENSPELDAVPAYTLNRLRVRTTDARNKMDAHRTLLDRYMPETFGAEQDVSSAVLCKYSELVDRARRLGHKCQTLGKDYERSYAARREIPSIMRTNAYSDYYYY